MTCNNFLGFVPCQAAYSSVVEAGILQDTDACRSKTMICVPSGKSSRFAYSWQHVAEDGVAQGCLHKPRWLAFGLISFEATLEETPDAWM